MYAMLTKYTMYTMYAMLTKYTMYTMYAMLTKYTMYASLTKRENSTMANNDIIVSMGEDNEETVSGFFGNLNTPKKVTPKKPRPENPPTPEDTEKAALPARQSPPAKTRRRAAASWTSMRITDSAKGTIYRAHQCYDIATGRHSSMSDFLELCVRRALPRISKEASDIFRSAAGSADQQNSSEE